MNLAHVILVIAFLESSLGLNMDHPYPRNHGWTGISDIAILDLNARAGWGKYKAADMDDRARCFEASAEHINNYLRSEWTAGDVFLFWRCGIRGMKTPTAKQRLYAWRGIWRLRLLERGDERWRK